MCELLEGDAGRVADIIVSDQCEACLDPGFPYLRCRIHEFLYAFVPDHPGREDGQRDVVGRRHGLETFSVDPSSEDDMTVLLCGQTHFKEKRPVIRVLKNDLCAGKRFFVKALHDFTDHTDMRPVGKEHIAQPGYGVDDGVYAGLFCR